MADILNLQKVASQVRRDIVRMVTISKSGHPGGSLGITDVMTALYFNEMSHDPKTWTREGKGQDMLIRAFYQYTIESVDNSSLVFLPGDGEMLDSCKQLVNDFKLNKQILFPGRLSKEEVLDYFDRSNILVCTSISETFSQILAEAFCLGKCIISTPVGIANDIIEDEKNGFIINNETQLKNVLLKLSDNLQLVNNMGLNNFTQKEQFSWQRISQDYAIICKSLLKQINNE